MIFCDIVGENTSLNSNRYISIGKGNNKYIFKYCNFEPDEDSNILSIELYGTCFRNRYWNSRNLIDPILFGKL